MPIGTAGPRFRIIQAGTVRAGRQDAAGLTTALTGANNDLTFTATAVSGSGGNSKTVAYVNSGASQTLLVTVTGNATSVRLATDAGSVITSTAAQVAAAVNAAVTSGLTAANATGNDGTGVVTVLAASPLSGGASYAFGAGR